MKRLILTVTLLLASTAWAAPYDDAAAANLRGDYAAELKITRPLAARGEAWAQHALVLESVERKSRQYLKWQAT